MVNRRRRVKSARPLWLLIAVVAFGIIGCAPDSTGGGLRTRSGPAGIAGTPSRPTAKATFSERDLAHFTPEMKAIYDRGRLRVAMFAQDRPPFFAVDQNGHLAGSDVDLAKDIAAKLGVEVEISRTAQSFDEVVEQVATGAADIAVSKLSATLSRAQKVLFSQAYLTLRQGVLINRLKLAQLGQPAGIDTLTLLKTSPIDIGAMGGTSYVNFARELFPAANIVEYTSLPELTAAALSGAVTAIFYDELLLVGIVTENPEHAIELQLMLIQEQTDPISIAVPPGNTQMLNWINLYLETNKARIDNLLIAYGVKSPQFAAPR